jgi:hypothetical protein
MGADSMGGRAVHRSGRFLLACLVATVLAISSAGCHTSWQPTGRQFRPVQSVILMSSVPQGAEILINGKSKGNAPCRLVVEYEREYESEARRVTLYQTQPALAGLLTVFTCGLYLPFGMIPRETETRHTPLEAFQNNLFIVQLRTEGGPLLTKELTLRGEPTVELVGEYLGIEKGSVQVK